MATDSRAVTAWFAWQSLRATARGFCRKIDLRVEGLDRVPREGGVVLAARHFHHFWDGCVLLATLPRPMRATVTLDWVDNPRLHRVMSLASDTAGWTVIPRFDHQHRLPVSEKAQLLAATRSNVAALRNGDLVLVFPEGYPTIDPNEAPKRGDDEMLPFKPGFLRFATLAERDGRTRAPVVPVGFEYRRLPAERWGITVRFGEAQRPWPDEDAHIAHFEREVQRLSGLA